MKGYSLAVYSPVLLPAAQQRFIRSLTETAKGWKRSIRARGGFWQGSFHVEGTEAELQPLYDEWLGYHLVERCGGVTSWEGLFYELDLVRGGVRRRRSYDDLADAVQSTYTELAFEGEELIENTGFETAGAGGADVFSTWVEGVGTSGAVSQNGTIKHSGTYSCQLNGDENGDEDTNTNVHQNLNVTATARYRLTFWTRGDGTHAGRWGVRDPNASVWLVGPTGTGVPGTTWTPVTYDFTGPSDGEVVIWLIAPENLGETAYFDDVSVKERVEVVRQSDWALDEASIDRYGRLEEILVLDRYPQDTSEGVRDSTLAERGTARARTVSVAKPGTAVLDVAACGYIFTANWMHITEGDGADHNLDHWIRAMVGSEFGLSANHIPSGGVAGAGDCQFLKAGNLAVNDFQVAETTAIDERVWDRVDELARLGDRAKQPWAAWADVGRLVHYQPVSSAARYYLRNGLLYDGLAATRPATPWLIRPGVVRDMGTPQRTEPGAWLTDARDFWMSEVEVDETGQVIPKTEFYSEADTLAAQLQKMEQGR